MLAILRADERRTVFECLRAAAYGPFFDDYIFSTLFGLNREQVIDVVEAWPIVDDSDQVVANAISNSFNNPAPLTTLGAIRTGSTSSGTSTFLFLLPKSLALALNGERNGRSRIRSRPELSNAGKTPSEF